MTSERTDDPSNLSRPSLLNVIDVEATCWDGEPPRDQVSEIIEIGVCVLDLHTLERVERRTLLVRPERSQVSAFCTALTSLKPEDVAGGLPFSLGAVIAGAPEKHQVSLLALAEGGASRAALQDEIKRLTQRECAATLLPPRVSKALADRTWVERFPAKDRQAIDSWMEKMPAALKTALNR